MREKWEWWGGAAQGAPPPTYPLTCTWCQGAMSARDLEGVALWLALKVEVQWPGSDRLPLWGHQSGNGMAAEPQTSYWHGLVSTILVSNPGTPEGAAAPETDASANRHKPREPTEDSSKRPLRACSWKEKETWEMPDPILSLSIRKGQRTSKENTWLRSACGNHFSGPARQWESQLDKSALSFNVCNMNNGRENYVRVHGEPGILKIPGSADFRFSQGELTARFSPPVPDITGNKCE